MLERQRKWKLKDSNGKPKPFSSPPKILNKEYETNELMIEIGCSRDKGNESLRTIIQSHSHLFQKLGKWFSSPPKIWNKEYET